MYRKKLSSTSKYNSREIIRAGLIIGNMFASEIGWGGGGGYFGNGYFIFILFFCGEAYYRNFTVCYFIKIICNIISSMFAERVFQRGVCLCQCIPYWSPVCW